MKRLVIIGAGGFGREVLAWTQDTLKLGEDYHSVAFLDANTAALDGYGIEWPIIGDPKEFTPTPDDLLVCGIGTPAVKLELCRHLLQRGGNFPTIIHPTATVGPRCTLGRGCILCPGSIATTDIVLGDFVMLNLQATVGHNAVLGDGCTLSCHADATGYVRLGEGVFMGSHASVLPGVEVGDFAIVGAGSVAVRPVKARTTVVGMPARELALPKTT